MAAVLIGPRCNRQVTCDSDPNNDRSESELVVNPLDPYNLVGASKRFTDPADYLFSLAPYATFDGGQTWTESSLTLPSIPGKTVAGTSDPTVCFDDLGTAYLLGLIWGGPPLAFLGMVMYMSSDGGRTWGLPNVIDQGPDDKQAMAADLSPTSPYRGHVYAAWDLITSPGGIVFARSTNHGATWTAQPEILLVAQSCPPGALLRSAWTAAARSGFSA
ncbi:MAG TPA: sialidase family protein [Candidatus Dormibacteraeota bacterium]|nr:sialidase family protein [Candidatus Dormibacteraeota bacterium]